VAEFAFVPNIPNWEKAFNLPGGMVDRHVEKIAIETSVDAIITSPKRTGRMSLEIRPERDGPTSWKVVAGAPYSIYVHEGTGIHAGRPPYVILPKKPGGRLRFYSHGKVVFARSVLHPGIKAQPFLTTALGRAMRTFTSH